MSEVQNNGHPASANYLKVMVTYNKEKFKFKFNPNYKYDNRPHSQQPEDKLKSEAVDIKDVVLA